jgi:2-oxoglutarate dehydrogenase E1 component
MQPKSLLRLKEACSSLDEMSEGTHFVRLIPETSDSLKPADEIKRLVLCSGKVYYDLARARELNGIDDVALVRVEQLAPFPFDLVKSAADTYPNAEIVWSQEEPQNQGAWHHVDPRIETSLRASSHHATSRPQYAGRPPTASTATGHKYSHIAELHSLLADALLTGDKEVVVDRVEGGFPVWS